MVDAFVEVAKAVAEPNRLRILKMLEDAELCVCHITERLGLAQSTVSRHLAVLRRAGLVSDRKDGLWVYYRLPSDCDHPHARAFLDLVREQVEGEATPEAVANCCGPDGGARR